MHDLPSNFPHTLHPTCPQGKFPNLPTFFPGPVALNTSSLFFSFIFGRQMTKRHPERC